MLEQSSFISLELSYQYSKIDNKMHIVLPRTTIKKITSKPDDTKRYANIQKTNGKEREESPTIYIMTLNVN